MATNEAPVSPSHVRGTPSWGRLRAIPFHTTFDPVRLLGSGDDRNCLSGIGTVSHPTPSQPESTSMMFVEGWARGGGSDTFGSLPLGPSCQRFTTSKWLTPWEQGLQISPPSSKPMLQVHWAPPMWLPPGKDVPVPSPGAVIPRLPSPRQGHFWGQSLVHLMALNRVRLILAVVQVQTMS